MTLESEIPFVPRSAPDKLRPVFVGAYDEKCSVQYFRDFLPDSSECEEISSRRTWDFRHRTFWYPEKAPSGSQQLVNSIQQKIRTFLLSFENFMPNFFSMTALVQFWAPVTTKDGKRTLSVSKQPFSAKMNMKGLCRYRYYCQELCRLENGREVCPYFGPVGRAFTSGSLECSPEVANYSEEDFPLKNHVKHCGFSGYLALPLFELGNADADGQLPPCVGVLEFVSCSKYTYFSSLDTEICTMRLKEVGLAFRYPSHSEAITQIRPYFNFPRPPNALRPPHARKANPDKLSSSLDIVRKKYSLPLVQIWLPCICNGSEVLIECEPNTDSFSEVTHLVCGLNCLDLKERSLLNERQFVWPSSYWLCDSQVYFVKKGVSWVGRAHSLKKICFIKDIRQFSIADYPLAALCHSSNRWPCFAIPLQLVDPKLPPLVLEVFLPTQYNFDADQGAILKGILSTFARELSKYNANFGLRKEEKYIIEPSHFDAIEIEELQVRVPTGENVRPYILPCNKTTSGRSTLKRKCPSSREMRPTRQRNDVLHVQQMPEVPPISVDSSNDEDQHSGIRYSASGKSKEKEEEAATVPIPLPANGKEKTFGPRNGDFNIPSNGKGTMPENGNAVDDSCTLIVRARHNDDFVRFPFSSNSGIEGLRGDLLKRFELKDGSFKLKYEDDGYWIMLSCSEDLSFYMHTLKSSGQTTMDLSVFTTT